MRKRFGLGGMALLALLALLTLRGTGRPEEQPSPKVDPQAVNRAIDRGVAFLKQQQNAENGTWVYGGEGKNNGSLSLGLTALAGLTLLHSGVAPKDPSVQKAARFLRTAWAAMWKDPNKGHDVDTTYDRRTYSVALAILFLDELGEAGDNALIRLLATWLVKTQRLNTGGWGYGVDPSSTHGDNSNTQFALLGMWAGKRHGVAITVPLARTASRFYLTHNKDGGWSYSPEEGGKDSTLAMSCVGLMALALRHAAANEDILRPRTASAAGSPRALSNVAEDDHVVSGFRYVQQCLRSASEAGNSWTGDNSTYQNAYYALWSLERVAVAYNLRTIGGLDWYAIGARFLLAKQQDDGRWQGSWDLADTCFALLFLRRANLVPEATNLLEGKTASDDKPALSSSIRSPTSPSAALEKILTRAPAPQPSVKEVAKPLAGSALDQLIHKLGVASAAEQDLLLKQWRDGEDALYTPALAKAIATLQGAAQRKARAALADHCTRLNFHQRDEYLRSDDAEIRRAAVLACAVRNTDRHFDRVIELLQDPVPSVANVAHDVLCSLTGKDFGPPDPSTVGQRASAIEAWQNWRKKQQTR